MAETIFVNEPRYQKQNPFTLTSPAYIDHVLRLAENMAMTYYGSKGLYINADLESERFEAAEYLSKLGNIPLCNAYNMIADQDLEQILEILESKHRQ